MRPTAPKYRRRDAWDNHHYYPYANKKWHRKTAARKARRLGVMSNAEYRKAYDVWWSVW